MKKTQGEYVMFYTGKCFKENNIGRVNYTKLYNGIKALVKQVMWFMIAVC